MSTRAWLLIYGTALSMPLAAGLFRVWVNQDAVRLGYELSREEKDRRQLQDLARQLEIERAAERSPEHLLQWATKLGLRPPTPEQILKKDKSTSHAEKAGTHGQP